MTADQLKNEIRDLEHRIAFKRGELQIVIGKSYKEQVMELFQFKNMPMTKCNIEFWTLIPDRQLSAVLGQLVREGKLCKKQRGLYDKV